MSGSDSVAPTAVARTVASAGETLAVWEYERPGAPTLILVHGYPDDHTIWEPVANALAAAFHVVIYDVKGAGGSSRPRHTDAYVLEKLAEDLAAVAAAVAPGRAVHLVGHDWGSIQGWGAVTGEAAGRIASFTSISGPCLEHFGRWVRDRLRRPTPRHVRELLGQLARSWYLAGGAVPGLGQLVWRLGGTRAFPAVIRRMERIERPPVRLDDALYGMRLYRANAMRLLRPRRAARTCVPVQVIVPTRDAFVSPHQSEDVARYAERCWRREVALGHWGALRREPATVARWIAELVGHVEGAPESADLAAARVQEAAPATGTTGEPGTATGTTAAGAA